MNTLTERDRLPKHFNSPDFDGLDYESLMSPKKEEEVIALYNQTEIAKAIARGIESYCECTGETVKPGALSALILGAL